MILSVDRIRHGDAIGNTVAVSFQSVSGTAAVDTDYPITNIYDSTSTLTKNQSFFLRKYVEVEFDNSGHTFAIKIDLGASQSVTAGMLSGLDITGDISEIDLEYSDNDSTWASFKAITAAGGSVFNTMQTGKIAFIGSAAASHRYWRFKFTADSGTAGVVKVGYASVYGGGVTVGIAAPSIRYENVGSESVALSGTPNRNNTGGFQVFPVSVPIAQTDPPQFLAQIAQGSISTLRPATGWTVGGEFVDPAIWPIIGLFNDDLEGASTADTVIKQSLNSAMVVIDRSMSFTYNLVGTIDPDVSFTAREWV